MKSKTDSKAKTSSKGKLGDFNGHSITSTIRAMGKAGWTFEEVRAAMTKHGLKPADNTIRIQLSAGRSGKQAVAAIEAAKLKAMRPKVAAKK